MKKTMLALATVCALTSTISANAFSLAPLIASGSNSKTEETTIEKCKSLQIEYFNKNGDFSLSDKFNWGKVSTDVDENVSISFIDSGNIVLIDLNNGSVKNVSSSMYTPNTVGNCHISVLRDFNEQRSIATVLNQQKELGKEVEQLKVVNASKENSYWDKVNNSLNNLKEKFK